MTCVIWMQFIIITIISEESCIVRTLLSRKLSLTIINDDIAHPFLMLKRNMVQNLFPANVAVGVAVFLLFIIIAAGGVLIIVVYSYNSSLNNREGNNCVLLDFCLLLLKPRFFFSLFTFVRSNWWPDLFRACVKTSLCAVWQVWVADGTDLWGLRPGHRVHVWRIC